MQHKKSLTFCVQNIDIRPIFTTNYDENLGRFTGKTIYYLHGAFHVMDYKYDKDGMAGIAFSFKNCGASALSIVD